MSEFEYLTIREYDYFIRAFKEPICNTLDIGDVEIMYSTDADDFSTETEMAHYKLNENTILMNARYFGMNMKKVLPYIIFALAHELRHVWQRNKDTSIFRNHVSSSKLNIEEYNKQDEEMDANAFAINFVDEHFGEGWDCLNAMEKIRNKELEERIIQMKMSEVLSQRESRKAVNHD